MPVGYRWEDAWYSFIIFAVDVLNLVLDNWFIISCIVVIVVCVHLMRAK